MLYFKELQYLIPHLQYLRQTLAYKDLFLVGGSIRDILLGITKNPTDIDLTCAGHPDALRDAMCFDEASISRFRTEKYGTMTIIPKEQDFESYVYELTPFRTEGTYTNVRHPDDIERSSHLLEDSKRRDFTINCIYACSIDVSEQHKKNIDNHPTSQLHTKEKLLHLCHTGKDFFLHEQQILILQDHAHIAKAFPNGIIDEEYILEHSATVDHWNYDHTPEIQQKNIEHGSNTLLILVDPHGGLKDLLVRKIMTVGDPNKRFTEDALRILRGVRFPNILNQRIPNNTQQNNAFDIEKNTRTSMIEHAHLIKTLAKERLHEELVKVFSGNNPFGYICLLDELGCIELLFPAVAACKHNIQPIRYHPFDTYTHTILTLHSLQQTTTNYLAKCAMLYHDVGKPEQYAYISEQKALHEDAPIDMSGYLHHTQTGAEIAKKEFSDVGFSKKEVEEIARYIRWHHRPGEILESNEKNRTKKIRQLLSEGGFDRTMNLLDIAIADRNGQFNPLQPAAISDLVSMKEHIEELHITEGRFTMKELAISGNDLIEKYNLTPGPDLGVILAKCFDWVLSDVPRRNSKKQILAHVKTLL